MAKPILHVQIVSGDNLTRERLDSISEGVCEKTNNEYHVLVTHIYNGKEASLKIECFNDCKGLPDADIEALIKSIK